MTWRARIADRDDRGFFAAWTAILSVGFWVLIGFMTDAGLVLREHSDAFGVASAAGRAGAQGIDQDALLTSGDLLLDPALVREHVDEYMADLDDPRFEIRDVTVDGLEVTVELTGRAELRLLPGSVDYDVAATVRAVQSGAGAPVAPGP